MKTITIGEEFKEKYSFRETCFGIVIHDNKLLLVKKKNVYSLVGGGIEKDEIYTDCLTREFLEESGYIVKSNKELVCINCYWLAKGEYPMLSKANIFEVEIDIDNKKDPLEEGCSIEWVDFDKCLDLLPLPYHKRAIEYYSKKKQLIDC